jgi:putative ABC transport system substrate-binding protein
VKRRTALASTFAALASASAAAQLQAKRPVRIAWLASVPVRRWPPFAVFTDAMRQLGWVEGQHYVVDEASYDGHADRIPAAVAELMARKPDLIIGSATPPMRALMRATSTIPIVMYAVGDPVGQGFVTNLARPGGNVTGLSSMNEGLLGKQFELLMQAAPGVRRVGVVVNPEIGPHLPGLRDVQAAAARAGVQARPVELRTPAEVDAAVETLRREQVGAVHFFLQPWMLTGGAERLARIAIEERWPSAMAGGARAGMLVDYGWKGEDLLRRLAYFVDRILRGTPPGEMPVEQPTRFYFTLNLKTARALGLMVPAAVQARADEVIE